MTSTTTSSSSKKLNNITKLSITKKSRSSGTTRTRNRKTSTRTRSSILTTGDSTAVGDGALETHAALISMQNGLQASMDTAILVEPASQSVLRGTPESSIGLPAAATAKSADGGAINSRTLSRHDHTASSATSKPLSVTLIGAVALETTKSLDYSSSETDIAENTLAQANTSTVSPNGLSTTAILGMSALLGVLVIGFLTGFIIIRVRRRTAKVQEDEKDATQTSKLATAHPQFSPAPPLSTDFASELAQFQQPPALSLHANSEERRRSISAAILAAAQRSKLSLETPTGASALILTGIVIDHFVPTTEDEIELHSGDRVYIFFQYEDGWMLGLIDGTSDMGFFPAWVNKT
ncbi:hypothetical protein HDU93_003010 [Gonapodya sp. JEL0774]|nr:hypothetical protein HDU93_003010 [Gonapodya sp. JEL0774]